MELYPLRLKTYRSIFFQVIIANLAAIITSRILVNGEVWQYANDTINRFTIPLLGVMIVLAAIHTSYVKKQVQLLPLYEVFEDRVARHRRIYALRMLWHLVSCLVSCIIYVLADRYMFFYFAIFDFLVSLAFFPNKKVFMKELGNKDILFY